MDPARSKPYIWATWVSKLLAGEQQCTFASWYRAHYQYQKRPDRSFNLAKWTADHNALVARRVDELRGEGWQVAVENENAFRLHGKAATLAGKCDVVARRDGAVLVVDGKTGQQRNSDFFQVLIYMAVLPKVFGGIDGARLSGEVCYAGHRIAIAPDELTEPRAADIWATVQRLAHDDRPLPVPSAAECRFCDLSAVACPQRVDEDVPSAVAAEF